MRVLITGANGLIGRELTSRLLAQGTIRGRVIDALLVLDKDLSGLPEDSRLRRHTLSLCDAASIRRVLADGIDLVFHLAGVSPSVAEIQYELGYQLNLLASQELFSQLRSSRKPAVLVFASSTAVYGRVLPTRMDEQAAVKPDSSYGYHSVMVEYLLESLSRRGEVDGRAIRLPDLVAPHVLNNEVMSNLVLAVSKNEMFRCPVSPDATMWRMSVGCAVHNLIHAAELDLQSHRDRRIWQLPVLHLSVAKMIDALSARFGRDCLSLINFDPVPELTGGVGSFLVIKTPLARAAGFTHDGTATSLLKHVLASAPVKPRRPKTKVAT